MPANGQGSNRPTNLVLVTGATGYVGGRLYQELSDLGYPIRCMARNPDFLRSRVSGQTEVVAGDVLDLQSLQQAMTGVEVAYYLIHSMSGSGKFEESDRRAAENFGTAARRAGVRRIIYLGGLGAEEEELSSHLSSRHQVGSILRESGVPVTEFRASIIIGSGSLSYEMIRALVERLPVMITPRWVEVPAQPISIGDVLRYLVGALELESERHETFEIGGADIVSYAEIMREYARQRQLRRWMVRVPVLTPRLSSLWLGLVTPLYARIGRILIDSIKHPTVVRNARAREVFHFQPIGMREAIASALGHEDREYALTRWSDAQGNLGANKNWGGVRFGNRLVDSRTLAVGATPEQVFNVLQRIGGANGWYYGDFLWRLRGWLDLLAGGVGMRRGRRHATQLMAGDVVDCWRVEEAVPPKRLRLSAEMKLPGRAWLQFEVEAEGEGSRLRQTAIFDPVGLFGLIYWYALYPLHELVFRGMIRGIRAASQSGQEDRHSHASPIHEVHTTRKSIL